MRRPWCFRCRRPKLTCVCSVITPFLSRTRFVLLVHPREYRRTRIGTGWITHLALPNSEVCVGVDFRCHDRVNALLDDGQTDCRLVYPGKDVQNMSRGEYRADPTRQRVFFLIDGTWPCARKVLRLSSNLQLLPRVGFDVATPSHFAIKRQPRGDCLATIEAVHRCLQSLAEQGHERFGCEDGRRLLAPLRRIMEIQAGYPGAPPCA